MLDATSLPRESGTAAFGGSAGIGGFARLVSCPVSPLGPVVARALVAMVRFDLWSPEFVRACVRAVVWCGTENDAEWGMDGGAGGYGESE